MLPLSSLWGHLYGLYKLMYAQTEREEGGFGVKLVMGIYLKETR